MKIPHVPKHERANIYGYNNKRWCKCEKCKALKERHKKVYRCRLFNWHYANATLYEYGGVAEMVYGSRLTEAPRSRP